MLIFWPKKLAVNTQHSTAQLFLFKQAIKQLIFIITIRQLGKLHAKTIVSFRGVLSLRQYPRKCKE